jgi:transketolase
VTTTLAAPDLAITTVRTLAIDGVQAARSGHPGAPMGLAPVGWTLFSKHLRHSPADPAWPERDRFVLSAGHASMLLYALLNLTGYDLPLEELRRFRQLGSETPGHPERGDTPGVEITTGPLGQGFGNAVGFAIAEAMLAARYNRPGHEIVDHRTWFICSDGDLMEGISHEAASIAGFLGLGKLIGIWDDNRISLDGPTSLAFDEDVPARFAAYGWRVLRVEDGNDVEAIDAAMTAASQSDGRPTLIACRTHIGFGSPNKQDTAAAHGSPLGPDEAVLTKRAYGWPEDSSFLVPDEVAAWRAELRERGLSRQRDWEARREAYAAAHPAEAAELARVGEGRLPDGWEDAAPAFAAGESLATRASAGVALNAFAAAIPEIVQGAADLSSSTSTTLTDMGAVGPGDFAGRNLYYGVREHAMGAITNGIAAHAGLRPVCSTFFTFSDYMKNTIRLAALMRLPSIFVFTHDSVALGEDGPTHQPIEHLAALRAIPGLVTIRPADAREAAAAWRVAIARTGAPTALVLSRQGLPTLDGPAAVDKGAYVLAGGDDCAILATGSEVSTALVAREALAADGVAARVVSMPSFELFREQDAAYRDSVLPPSLTARVAVEAASPFGWAEWTGSAGTVVGIDRFGLSAPGAEAMEALGITPRAVAAAAHACLAAAGRPSSPST